MKKSASLNTGMIRKVVKKLPAWSVIIARWLLADSPTAAAIDITNRCNLRCTHCYWWRQEHPQEMDDVQIISFMKSLRKKGFRAAILYGGEPALRPEVCIRAGTIFDTLLAFTNGTKGFPELENGQWVLSLEGTREVNDRIRGKGVFDTAVENLKKAKRPPIVHMTVSAMNSGCIEEFAYEMMSLPVKGVGFSFYTPNRSSSGPDLLIPLEQRNLIIRRLVRLRKRFGEKIAFTGAMARQFSTRGDFSKWNGFSACPVSSIVRCFRSDGSVKLCTYGDDADCARCGCAAVAAYRGAFKPFDYMTFRVILGLMIPEANVKD